LIRRQVFVFAYVLASVGLASTGDPEPTHSYPLYDYGQISPQSNGLSGDEFVSPVGLILDNGGPNYTGGNFFSDFRQAEDFILVNTVTVARVTFFLVSLIIDARRFLPTIACRAC